MGRFDEYLAYFDQYRGQYGSSTTVLYQCGMFYEVYGVDNATETFGHAGEIANLLNIQLTRADKSILENSRKNPLMAGFPCSSCSRNVQILVDCGYTVVIVDQVGEKMVGSKKEMTRAVTAVHSPATFVSSARIENYLVSIFITTCTNGGSAGMTAIDLSTGTSTSHHAVSRASDQHYHIDECYRFVQTFQPTEIIIIGEETFNSETSAVCHKFSLSENPEFKTNSFHNSYLRQFFDSGHLSPVEYLDLDFKAETAVALTVMLQFCMNHNKLLLKSLSPPKHWDNLHSLVLDNNTVSQLNLISDKSYSSSRTSSVFGVMCDTSTNMGKRLLKDRLLNPVLSIDELNRRYDAVDRMLAPGPCIDLIKKSAPQKLYMVTEKFLREIIDIERFHRKIEIGNIQPAELSPLITSYRAIHEMLEKLPLLLENGKMSECKDTVRDFLEFMDQHIDANEMAKWNIDTIETNFFKPSVNTELNELDHTIALNKSLLEKLATDMSSCSKSDSSDHVVLKCGGSGGGGDEGYYLHVSKPRFKVIQSKGAKGGGTKFLVGDRLVSLDEFEIDERTKTHVKIRGGIISQISCKIESAISALRAKVIETYLKFLSQITEKFMKRMKQVSSLIAEIDVSKSAAKTTDQNKYIRPTLTDKYSYVRVTGMRHPIIEKLDQQMTYVAHNLSLDEASNGVLLYGINASGKSSTMKSIGVAVVLAQAGFFVPADSFELGIYHKIMTRILGNDNIFKGLSSFAVEMTELRGILSRADNRSLVLGDEICHGTETYSAISLVAASVIHLSNVGASFIFATHLHQLSEIAETKNLKNVRQLHLTVHYDTERDQLIYDRKLKEGPGDSLYGIEVARALKVPVSIVTTALDIRRKYFSAVSIGLGSVSVYNKNVHLLKCGIPECGLDAVETHHIMFQSESDERGFIDHVPKNHRSNLVPLCEAHHKMVHCSVAGEKELIIRPGRNAIGELDFVYRPHLTSFKVKDIN